MFSYLLLRVVTEDCDTSDMAKARNSFLQMEECNSHLVSPIGNANLDDFTLFWIIIYPHLKISVVSVREREKERERVPRENASF